MAIDQPLKPSRKTRRTLPAVWMRAGTSKGLFLHRRDLPSKQEQWSPIILAAMGSADSDPRQLNGVAGATSTTSKVAVIAPSNRLDADVEYTFVQVSVGSSKLDFSGNCGNIAAGVGPFAVDEGLVKVASGSTFVNVRILNTNTGRIIVETLEVDDFGHFAEDGDYLLAGTRSTGSHIGVSFERPAGAMTGYLLPSGRVIDTLLVPDMTTGTVHQVEASLVDAANPFVLVNASTLPGFCLSDPNSAISLAFMEDARRQGAVKMGLAADVAAAAKIRGTPKIAILSAPSTEHGEQVDLNVTALSMGKVHGSLQLTGAVCISAALCTPGTVPHTLAGQAGIRHDTKDLSLVDRKDSFVNVPISSRRVVLRHPSGIISSAVRSHGTSIESVQLSRTARRLFEGNVCFMA